VPAVESPPYFHALAVFACKSNRLYRIYVRPDELVFIWAGAGMEGVAGARAAGASGGLVGALVSSLIARLMDSTEKNQARKAVLDGTPLDQLIGDDPKNLRASINKFEEVRIGPRSERHARSYSDHEHRALLFLRHRTLGKYRLGLQTDEDVRVAQRELPRVLGKVFQNEIEWSDQDNIFVKRNA
jgi:hypothetical protein